MEADILDGPEAEQARVMRSGLVLPRISEQALVPGHALHHRSASCPRQLAKLATFVLANSRCISTGKLSAEDGRASE